ncbi:hypothetical protein R9C00_05035 [Flammeovirgaceae bacterium SG7u.111]|nr:hypothetical protein [Flammeovirgaceae bacterium SG7u.132]WPO36809.1 hypothetical protein R9C00_05035 [Flammeovirgaceae bacterium SG7u.111]
MKRFFTKKSLIGKMKTLGLGLALLSLAGCSEDLDPIPSTYSKMLTGETQKSWRFEKFEFIFDDESIRTETFDPGCVFSGKFTFYRKGKILEILDNCDPTAEPEPISIDWGINVANSTLSLGGLDPYDLVELTPTTLVFGFKTNLSLSTNIGIDQDQSGFARYTYKVKVE